MKKNILHGLVVLLTLLFLVSACAPDYETKFDVKSLEVPDDDLAIINFAADGGNKSVRVKTNVNAANWTATSNADWCKIDKQTDKVVVSADKNSLFVPRVALITIAYGHQTFTIDVMQQTDQVSTILIDGKKEGSLKKLPTAGGSVSVKVHSNLTLDYITIPDSTSWVKLKSIQDEEGKSEKVLVFEVAPSYDSNPRRGVIMIQSAQNPLYVSSFNVEQDKKVWGAATAVPLTASMLSANATQTDEGPGLPGLVDGDVNTYYHTLWSGASPGKKPHYVQINLEKPLQFLKFEYDSRNGGDGGGDVTRVGIWVSETDENNESAWEKASTIYFPLPKGRGQRSVANNVAAFEKPYKYVRFTPEARRSANPINPSGSNGWWNMANMFLFTYDE